MAKPAHTRVTVEGHFGTSASSSIEKWSFNLNSPDDVAISAATEATLNTYADAIHDAFVEDLCPILPANVYVDKVTIASVDGSGVYRVRGDGSYVKGVRELSVPGGMAAIGMPLQIALCVSLVTARSGPTGKGRFFLPWPNLSLDPDTRLVPESQITGIADNVGNFLQAVNDVNGVQVSVVSSKGYSSPVTALRIGRAADTMRSRREDISESYVSAGIPT